MSTISLGKDHCCVCAGVCWHVGGPWLCDMHTPHSASGYNPPHVVTSSDISDREVEIWRRAYERKVEDFANETRRTSTLVVAIQSEGHGRGDHSPECVLCRALTEAGAWASTERSDG